MDFRQLKSRLNKRPEEWKDVGDHRFLLRLPPRSSFNDLAATYADGGKITTSAFVKMARPICESFVSDWEKVTVEDLTIGFDVDEGVDKKEEVDFGPQAFAVYLDDHPDEMLEIASAAMNMWETRLEKDTAKKKPSKNT